MATAQPAPFTIERRFCGPPDSGNGGYVAGRLAAHLDTTSVVRLHLPPPLERPLRVTRDGGVVTLLDDATAVATARPTTVDLAPPPAPTIEAAESAQRGFRGFETHPFAGCFVCGTAREARDGLRIFPGPLAGREDVACVWRPDDTLADPAAPDRVAPEFVWAALDCPGAFAFPQVDGGVSLLGEIAVAIHEAPRIGAPTILVGWESAHEGRKHYTGTALFDPDGGCLAVGRATWIEIAPAAG